jgi:hypothetical protein
MDTTKKWKITAFAMGVVLLCSLGSLAYALYSNYCYRRVLGIVSEDAGTTHAMKSFYQGHLRIYEIDTLNAQGGFSGRRDGPFEVWLDEYRAKDPEAWKFSRRIFWEEHNKMMRYMQDHPGKFRAGSAAITNSIPNATK